MERRPAIITQINLDGKTVEEEDGNHQVIDMNGREDKTPAEKTGDADMTHPETPSLPI